jgi:Na+/H+-dicarboxylate symporter
LEDITQVGGIVAINYIVILIMSGLMLLKISIKYKITIKEFFQKTSKILLISLATASNTAAMSKNFEVVVNDLKIEERFCNFWLPLSYAIFSPSAASALVICVFYTAAFSGNTVAISDLLMTLFLALQLSMATPPVPGGIMPIYVMILGQLNLPTDSIGFLMMASVFVLNFSSAGSMIIRDCELIDVSHKVNLDKQ